MLKEKDFNKTYPSGVLEEKPTRNKKDNSCEESQIKNK